MESQQSCGAASRVEFGADLSILAPLSQRSLRAAAGTPTEELGSRLAGGDISMYVLLGLREAESQAASNWHNTLKTCCSQRATLQSSFD